MSTGPPPAAVAAAQAAFQTFVVEAFTLLGVGIFITGLRTYARIRTVGIRDLGIEDYLAWLAVVLYSIETALAYEVGHAANGLANNGMTPEQRASLSPSDPEYSLRVLGSKIQLAGWSTYSTLLWTLKASLLAFYLRLTEGLAYHYRIRIIVGFVFLLTSYLIVALNLYLSCLPFHKNWQISPDPGNLCQPAISTRVIFMYLGFNVTTDLYIISIPLPMLWASRLKPIKKMGLMILFGSGMFVIVCAILRSILIVLDEENGAQLAGSWAVRETFVAVVTTNLPMIFPLLKVWLSPLLGSLLTSIRSTNKLDDATPKDFVTYGGSAKSWRGRGPPTANPITMASMNESEERMVSDDVKMQDLRPWTEVTTGSNSTPHGRKGDIRKDVEIEVVREKLPTVSSGGRIMSADEQARRMQGTFPCPGINKT